jgi:hypothetical protein
VVARESTIFEGGRQYEDSDVVLLAEGLASDVFGEVRVEGYSFKAEQLTLLGFEREDQSNMGRGPAAIIELRTSQPTSTSERLEKRDHAQSDAALPDR